MSHNQKVSILPEVTVGILENYVTRINCSLGLILLKKDDVRGLWNMHKEN
jgi:hypothetical protein